MAQRAWTPRPPWLYPHRSLEPDVAEAAALAYLRDPQATYASVATAFDCAWITVWRWVGWLAALVAPAVLLATAALCGSRRRSAQRWITSCACSWRSTSPASGGGPDQSQAV